MSFQEEVPQQKIDKSKIVKIRNNVEAAKDQEKIEKSNHKIANYFNKGPNVAAPKQKVGSTQIDTGIR